MNLLDLIQAIKDNELYPIPMEGKVDTEEFSGGKFSGSVDEYFLAAKALGAKVVLLYANKLDETDFSHEITLYEEDRDDSESEEFENTEQVDLTLANPLLSQFRKNVGLEYAFLLTAVSDLMNLDKYIEEDWWQAFQAEYNKAIDKVDEDQDAIRDKMTQLSYERQKDLVKLIKSLIDDPQFVVISTQRGMRSYALEKYPQLEVMDATRIKEEIQNVSDRIKAKGLDKKKTLARRLGHDPAS